MKFRDLFISVKKNKLEEKDREIKMLKSSLYKQQKSQLRQIKKIGKNFKLFVDDKSFEIIINQINQIGEGKWTY